MKKVGYIIYIAAALGALFLLFAAMPAAKSHWSAQTTDLAEMPELLSEGKTDLHVLSRYGKYFEDRFAFRTNLITADSRLNLALFNETAVDQVIAGKTAGSITRARCTIIKGRTVFRTGSCTISRTILN